MGGEDGSSENTERQGRAWALHHCCCPWSNAQQPATSQQQHLNTNTRCRVVTPPARLSLGSSFVTEAWHLTHSPSDFSFPAPLPLCMSLKFLNGSRKGCRHRAPGPQESLGSERAWCPSLSMSNDK